MATSSSSSASTGSSSGPEMTNLTMHDLQTITNQFSDENRVGKGSYGVVYRGEYNGYEIAVKRLFVINNLDEKAFTNEFQQLKKVRHENIIRLIAYCKNYRQTTIEIDGQKILSSEIDRALCFEYMPQRSLADHISDGSCIHDWATTYKIIRGTCEGLHYLHKGRGEGDYIYHLDLKPDNILLDKDMTPKIADFGLSRLFGELKTYQTSSRWKGTLGFMPQEYIHNGIISPKNDVFSLGVIIFYLVAGRIGYSDYCDSRPSRKTFTEKVQDYWKKKMRVAVSYYTWEEYTREERDLLGVKICIELAMSCVVTERAKRPSTEAIIDELQKLDVQIKKMSREKFDDWVLRRIYDKKGGPERPGSAKASPGPAAVGSPPEHKPALLPPYAPPPFSDLAAYYEARPSDSMPRAHADSSCSESCGDRPEVQSQPKISEWERSFATADPGVNPAGSMMGQLNPSLGLIAGDPLVLDILMYWGKPF